jgi:3-hexulose-6-phosphate synthase
MKDLGVDMVELHAGLDEQAAKTYKIDDLIEIAHEIELSFAIAGGVNEASIVQVQTSGAEVAVVGGAILQCAESFGECTRLTKLDSGATQ